MVFLREITKLTILNIVDNETDSLSSPCKCCEDGYEGQVASYVDNIKVVVGQAGGEVAELQRMSVAAHGLSLVLIAEYLDDDRTVKEEQLLFDAGPIPTVWSQNTQNLRLDLSRINTVVLSHYHMDHYGGFNAAIPDIVKAKTVQGDSNQLIVDLHEPVIVERGLKNVETGGISKLLPDTPTVDEIEGWGASVSLHREQHTTGRGCFYVSGCIPRLTDYETGLPNHFSKIDGEFVLDPDVKDERYVAVKLKGRGIVVFSACSHAGIVNVCTDVTRQLGERLVAVVGGLHLAGRNTEGRISRTIAGLKDLDPDLILAGHCTGWKAKAKFAAAFEYNFQVLTVGCRYTLNAMNASAGK